MIREEIKKLIKKSCDKLFIGNVKLVIDIEKPRRGQGDYAAIIYEKREDGTGKSLIPKVYEKIVKEINKNPNSKKFFKEVKFQPPIFINFFLTEEYLQKKIAEILKKGEDFGKLNIGKGKKIQVEFISANPTGPLTVGNARGGPFGDVLGNLFKKSGYKVEKAYYINDYGMQILALGHSVLKDKEAKYKGDYIDYLSKRIKEKDPYQAGKMAAKIIIKEMIKKTTERMGIKFDEWFSESTLYDTHQVEKVLKILNKKGLIYEKDKAKFFQSTKYGDQRDRVVVKADGWKTYLAGDIAYHRYKFEKKKFDKVINILGADHAGDVTGLKAGVEALGHKDKLDIVLLQFVTLFEKKEKLKMSKRSGFYVTMDELLEEVGSDVIRFFFLQKSANTHLNFDLDLAKEQSAKNPVYYIQYANARIHSILAKSKIKNQKSKIQIKKQNLKLLNHPSELELIKQLIRLPEVIEDTVKDYQVQRLPQYALNLATSFHQFYRDCQVLTETRSLAEARIGLILAIRIVLKNVLDLMGISAPEKM